MSEAAAATGDTGNTGDTGTGSDAAATAAAAAAAAKGGDDAAAAAAAAAAAGDGAAGDNIVWPENWRDKLSGGDAKVAEELGRYAEPGLIGKALIEAKNKIRSNTAATPLAQDATPEQVTAWREANGIPAEAKGYLEKLPEGIKIEEGDREGMEAMAESMHKVNAPPAVVQAAVAAYYGHIDNALAQRATMDKEDKQKAEESLRETYGAEYIRNTNDMKTWLKAAGGGIEQKVMEARTPEGTPLAADPEYMAWMINNMRALDPLVTVPGLGAGDPAAQIDSEIATIEKVMSDDFKKYQADAPMQARYLTLIQARDKGRTAKK